MSMTGGRYVTPGNEDLRTSSAAPTSVNYGEKTGYQGHNTNTNPNTSISGQGSGGNPHPAPTPSGESTGTTGYTPASRPPAYGQSSNSAVKPKEEDVRAKSKQANEANKSKETAKFAAVPKTDSSLGGAKAAVETTTRLTFADYYRTRGRGAVPRELASPTPASIRIYGKNKGTNNKYADLLPSYGKFFLESVQESHTERSQIVETFGDFYVFMYGERPPVYNFSGSLLNYQNASWAEDFMFMYERFLRGSRCVQQNAVVILTYGGRQIEGLLLNMSTQTTAVIEGAVGLQFSVVVFDRKTYNFSEDLGFTLDPDKPGSDNTSQSPEWLALLAKTAGRAGAGTSQQNVSKAQNSVKKVGKGGPSNTAQVSGQ